MISKGDPIIVTGGKRKQDVVVWDNTGTIKVTLWEQHIDLLEVGRSYSLKNFVVREYGSQKYLAMLRNGSEIVLVEDIGIGIESDKSVTSTELTSPEIIGVPQLDSYKAC